MESGEQSDETVSQVQSDFSVDHAIYLIKLGSLPVFIGAIQAFALAFLQLSQPVSNSIVIGLISILALILLVVSLRMQRGHAAWTPWAWIFMAFFVHINLTICLGLMKASSSIFIGGYIGLTLSLLIYSIWSAHRSLRCWHWLKFQNVKMTY